MTKNRLPELPKKNIPQKAFLLYQNVLSIKDKIPYFP